MARKPKRPAERRADAIAEIVGAIIDGEPPDELESIALKHEVPLDDAATVVDEARRSLRDAADVDRLGELGIAVRRLTEQYRKADRAGECQAAIRAQLELVRLLKLGDVGSGDADDPTGDGATAELARVRAHLEPFAGSVPANYPVSEIARIVVERLVASVPALETAS